MRECPAIAAAEIEQLRAKGVEPTLDEVAWLISLGGKVENPPGSINPLLAAAPLVAGCEPFFRLTNQARWWLALARDWLPGNAIAHALGYAHRFGRVPGAFDTLLTPGAALAAVTAWRDHLPINDDELLAVLSRLLDNDSPERPAAKDEDHALRLAQAEAISGIPVDRWALRTQDELYAVIIEGMRLSGQYGGTEADAVAKHSEQALVDLMLAVKEIEARHKNG